MVLLHHVGVHSRKRTDGQRFFDILHLNINSICNDVMNDNSAGTDGDCKIAWSPSSRAMSSFAKLMFF